MNKSCTGSGGDVRIIVIGQAPPRTPTSLPFERSRLFRWLEEVGIEKSFVRQHFCFEALVANFTGSAEHGHVPPTRTEINAYAPQLRALMRSVDPGLVIPVGTLAIREVLATPTITLASAVGRRFECDPFAAIGRPVAVVPLPHPSGASPWVHLDGNRALLTSALQLLRAEIDALFQRLPSDPTAP